MDWQEFERRAEAMFNDPAILEDLTEYDESCATLEQLQGLLLWDDDEVREVREGGVLITDDYPFTEFPLWRYLFGGRAQWHPQWDLNIGGWKEEKQRAASEQAPGT